MWLIISSVPYENSIENFNSYKDAKIEFDKECINKLGGRVIYIAEVLEELIIKE